MSLYEPLVLDSVAPIMIMLHQQLETPSRAGLPEVTKEMFTQFMARFTEECPSCRISMNWEEVQEALGAWAHMVTPLEDKVVAHRQGISSCSYWNPTYLNSYILVPRVPIPFRGAFSRIICEILRQK